MIKEIKDIDHLNKTLDQWNSVKNKNHWANLSTSIHADRFDPATVQSFIKNMFLSSIEYPEVMPYIKLWSYEVENFSLAGCVFFVKENFMTGKPILEECLWQVNGELATNFSQKKMLIKLLRAAENYGRSKRIDTICFHRGLDFHKLSQDARPINNYYTKNGFQPSTVMYYKKLR